MIALLSLYFCLADRKTHGRALDAAQEKAELEAKSKQEQVSAALWVVDRLECPTGLSPPVGGGGNDRLDTQPM